MSEHSRPGYRDELDEESVLARSRQQNELVQAMERYAADEADDGRSASAQRRGEQLLAARDRWLAEPDCILTWNVSKLLRTIRWLEQAPPTTDHRMMAFLSALRTEEGRRCAIECDRMAASRPQEDTVANQNLRDLSDEAIRAMMQLLRRRAQTTLTENERSNLTAEMADLTREVERRQGVTLGPPEPAGSPPPQPKARTLRDQVMTRAADIWAQRRRAEEERRQRVLNSWKAFYKTYARVLASVTTLVGMRVTALNVPGTIAVVEDAQVNDPESPLLGDNHYCHINLVCRPEGGGSPVQICAARIQWYSGNPADVYTGSGAKPWNYCAEPGGLMENQLLDKIVTAVAGILEDVDHDDPPDPTATRKGIDL